MVSAHPVYMMRRGKKKTMVCRGGRREDSLLVDEPVLAILLPVLEPLLLQLICRYG